MRVQVKFIIQELNAKLAEKSVVQNVNCSLNFSLGSVQLRKCDGVVWNGLNSTFSPPVPQDRSHSGEDNNFLPSGWCVFRLKKTFSKFIQFF